MEVDLGGLIGEVIAKFKQNRTGPKPIIFVKVAPDLARVPWNDNRLEKLIKHFLYYVLLANNPEMPLHVIVHERTRLRDLEGFVRVWPLYWIQLRIKGNGSGMIESMVEETFTDLGYRCEEWIGLEGSEAQLAIFSPAHRSQSKMVFCLDGNKAMRRCDLLIPVSERRLLTTLEDPGKKA